MRRYYLQGDTCSPTFADGSVGNRVKPGQLEERTVQLTNRRQRASHRLALLPLESQMKINALFKQGRQAGLIRLGYINWLAELFEDDKWVAAVTNDAPQSSGS